MKKGVNRTKMETNIFGKMLEALLESTKAKISRKDLATILGVSDSAISQWTTGNTNPDADKVKMLIALYQEMDLTDEERIVFDSFLSILELPTRDVWRKAPSKFSDRKYSDYLIQELHINVENSISILFYKLKTELYNQLLREIEIHKEFLIDHFWDKANGENNKHNETFYERAVKIKFIESELQSKANVYYLTNYVDKVKLFHQELNNQLKKYINDEQNNLFSCEIADGKDFERFFQDKNISRENYIVNLNEHGSNNFEIIQTMRESNDLPVLHYSRYSNVGRTRSIEDYLGKLGDIFRISAKAEDSYEITFNDPQQTQRELLSIEISEFSPDHYIRTNWKYNTMVMCYGYNKEIESWNEVVHSAVLNQRNYKKLKELAAYDVKQYAMEFDTNRLKDVPGTDWESTIAEKLKLLCRKRSSQKTFHSYLITPEHTQRQYSVEIIRIGNREKIIESRDGNSFVILIFGRLLIKSKRNHSDTTWITSYFNEQRNNPMSGSDSFSGCIHLLENDNHYSIQSQDDNSIALLVREY